MPDPIKPPAKESATRPDGRKGTPGRGGLPATSNRKTDLSSDVLTQQWMEAIHTSESAMRPRMDAVAPNIENPADVLSAIAAEAGMEKVSLLKIDFAPDLVEQVTPGIAKRYGAESWTNNR